MSYNSDKNSFLIKYICLLKIKSLCNSIMFCVACNICIGSAIAKGCPLGDTLTVEAKEGKIEILVPTLYSYKNDNKYSALIDRDVIHIYFDEKNAGLLYNYSKNYSSCHAQVFLEDIPLNNGVIGALFFLRESSQYTRNFVILINNQKKDNIDLTMRINKKSIRLIVKIDGDY